MDFDWKNFHLKFEWSLMNKLKLVCKIYRGFYCLKAFLIKLIEFKNHLGSKFGALSLVKLESIYLYIIEFLIFHTVFAKTLEDVNCLYSTKPAQSETRDDFSCFDKFYLVLVNKLWGLRLESEYFTSSFCLKVFE